MPGAGGSACGSPCSVSAIDLGWPGKLMISVLPRITATWRDRIAVATKRRLMLRICSPKPGITLSATASVASGVTSRGDGPVPPVVSTRSQAAWSTNSHSAALMRSCSSGINLVSQSIGFFSARDSQSRSAGSPRSS